MTTGLLEQLDGYFSDIDASQPVVTPERVSEHLDRVTNVPAPQSRPVRGRPRVWVAIAAAAIVATLVGVIPLLVSRSEQDTPPATVPSTVPTSVVSETPTTTTDTTGATTTTLAAAPVVPPGEGPRLEFVQVESPDDQPFVEGVWFDGAVYAVSNDRRRGAEDALFRSSDGFTWEAAPGFPGSSGDIRGTMLEADDDRLVYVVIPESDGPIRINVSTNGDDWLSTTIDVPILGESNGVAELRFADPVLAVGPRGIVMAASMTLVVDAERFANTLVGVDDGVHVEVLDIDLDRGVMTVQHIAESNGQQVGETREIDLNATSFGRDFTDILTAMAADPDWEPLIDRIVSTFTSGFAEAVVHYAWFSPDGTSWQPFPTTGPLFDDIQFASVIATPTGFIATASRTTWEPTKSVWESTSGTVWTESTDHTTGRGAAGGRYASSLGTWNGELVEIAEMGEGYGGPDLRAVGGGREVWTLSDPSQRLFSDIPTNGMNLVMNELGLIGATDDTDWQGPATIEMLLSVDGTSWSRWEQPEFGPAVRASIVGVGDDFVVIQVRDDLESDSLWVGRLP
ncbi:MAG: hypothetical protein ACR2N7_04565 [Acidimicrobiia bacterium]